MSKEYRVYHFSALEVIQNLIIFLGCNLLISYLFYHTFFAAIFLSPYFIIYQKKQRVLKAKQQRLMLTQQFKDALNALSAALEAGYSFENAIACSLKDLHSIYDQKADIINEFKLILSKSANHIPIEEAIGDFAERSGVEEIQYFYEVFLCARKKGGNLIQIMKKTSSTISEKIETSQEIETMIMEKKVEVSIMKMAPYVIILYLMIANPGFLSPLYFNIFGVVFMSILLAICIGLSLLAEKLMEIEV